MTSQIDLCNRALLSIGARSQISSVSPSDGSTEGDACAVLFTPTFEQLGRAAHWNCLRKQAVLSLIEAAAGTPENPLGTTLPLPPTPWLYAYSYPSDCLRVRSIVPSQTPTSSTLPSTTFNNPALVCNGESGQIRYAVAYDTDSGGNPIITILTNQTQAQGIYTVNQSNPVIWDSQFQAAYVASLGAFLVPALSLDMGLMDRCVKLAENMIIQARVSDGNEGVTVMDHTPDWILARGVSFYNYGTYANNNYDPMPWPTG